MTEAPLNDEHGYLEVDDSGKDYSDHAGDQPPAACPPKASSSRLRVHRTLPSREKPPGTRQPAPATTTTSAKAGRRRSAAGTPRRITQFLQSRGRMRGRPIKRTLRGRALPFPRRSPPGLFTRADRGGLKPAPACRLRGAHPHLVCSKAAVSQPALHPGLLSVPSWHTSSRPGESHPQALTGRVEDWRGGPVGRPLSVSRVSPFVPD